MSNPELDVKYIADLARLRLTDEEIATFEPQLAQILEYVNELRKVDVTGIDPMAHANPVYNVVREDKSRPGLPSEETLAIAPRSANDLFMVTKVIE